MHVVPLANCERESDMMKIKCGSVCMPGDATMKSPHHEEYSSSDFQHL